MPYDAENIITEEQQEGQDLREGIKKATTLAQMIIAACQWAKAEAVKAVEQEIAERDQRRCNWPKCPKCGARITNKDREKRQIKSMIGIVRWKRKVGRCPNGCEIGQVVPLDKEFGLEPDQRVSNELKLGACALAVFVPYQIATVLLKLLTGIELSPWSIWTWVQEVGEKAEQLLATALANLAAGQEPAPEPISAEITALPMVMGGDGVQVPFRRQPHSPAGKTKFQEVKIGIIARIKHFVNRRGTDVVKIQRKKVVAVLGNIDQLRDRLWLEALKPGIRRAPQVVWISDGARGLWRIFRERLADLAIGILDFYHAAQNIWKAASTWLDGRTNKSRDWFSRLRHLLRHGKPSEVLAEVHQPLANKKLRYRARKSLENLESYLSDHEQHLDYTRFKELGLPIGSGMVESACKWLIQQRFKCVGMRWSEDGFNHLLHLRIAWVNGRFYELFSITPPP